ncbi:hypothetical protein GGR58DRAFT_499512 [Xylaria digitata]|nr:hypothetical protein GGR58DRAFT_499512 [Xylaria digitata]
MASNSKTYPKLNFRRRRGAMGMALSSTLRLFPEGWEQRRVAAFAEALADRSGPIREAASNGEANANSTGSEFRASCSDTLCICQRAGYCKTEWSRNVVWLIIAVSAILFFIFVTAMVKALASLIMPVWRLGRSVWSASEIFRPT